MLRRLGFPAVGQHKSFVAAIAIDAVGSGIWMPISVLYFLTVTDLRLGQVGFALTVAQFTAIPFAMVAGQLIDRVGSHKVLQVGNLLQAAGFACYPFVHDVAAVALAVLVTSLGRALFFTAYAPTVLTVSNPGEREQWFGFVNALRNAGFGIGGIGTAIALSIGSDTAFHIVVVLNALSYVLSYFLLRSMPGGRGGERATQLSGWMVVLRDRGYRWLVMANFGYALGCLALNVVFPVYLVHELGLPGWLTGVVYVVNTGMIGIGQGIVVRAMSGYVRWRIVAFSAASMLLSFVMLAFVPGVSRPVAVVLALAAVAVFTLGEMTGGPVLASIAAEAPPPELRGRYQAVYQMSWMVSSAIAPALYLGLLQHGHLLVWAALGAIVVGGSLAAARMRAGIPLAAEAVTGR